MQRLDHTYQVLYSVRESLWSFEDATRYRLRKGLAKGVINLEGDPAAYDLTTSPSDEPQSELSSKLSGWVDDREVDWHAGDKGTAR